MSPKRVKAFFFEEWLFCLSLLFFVLSVFVTLRWPHYSLDEFEMLFILFVLFVVISGLQRYHILEAIAGKLQKGRWIGFKLITVTFLFSTFITNDISLIVMVPVTLAMRLHLSQKLWLISLETIAANAAAFLPHSTPQNLFIYIHYNLTPQEFILAIAPFCLVLFIFALLPLLFLHIDTSIGRLQIPKMRRRGWVYIGFFLLAVVAIFDIVPLFTLIVIPLYTFVIDREVFEGVDYYLLATFFLFFGISDNLSSSLMLYFEHPSHLFLDAVGFSQIISNVPAAIVLADFTKNWRALLWGVSVGGYGVLWGSLASLISYRLLAKAYPAAKWRYLLLFSSLNFVALFLGIALFYLLQTTFFVQ